MALTPEQLAAMPEWMRALNTTNAPVQTNSGAWTFGDYTDPTTGVGYRPIYSGGNDFGLGGPDDPRTFTGSYIGVDPNSPDIGMQYDDKGNFVKNFNAHPAAFDKEDLMGILSVLAVAGGGAMLGGQMGAAGGAAATPWEAGFVGTDALGGAGGALGAAGAGGGAALGAGGGGAIGTMAPLELLPTTMGEYALPGLMGTAGAAGAGGAAGSGLLSSLGGNGSSLLGLGASVLGGLAGAQGQNNETTTTKDMPDYMKQFMLGDNGVFQQNMNQLNASRSPARTQEWADIRNRGMGLLQKPQAGNPTAGWTFNR